MFVLRDYTAVQKYLILQQFLLVGQRGVSCVIFLHVLTARHLLHRMYRRSGGTRNMPYKANSL